MLLKIPSNLQLNRQLLLQNFLAAEIKLQIFSEVNRYNHLLLIFYAV